MVFDFWRVTPTKRSIRLRQKKGVLFHNPSLGRRVLFYSGSGLVAAALFFVVYMIYPVMIEYGRYFGTFKLKSQVVQKQILINEDKKIRLTEHQPTNFELFIPKIGAKSQIIPRVSPFNEDEYSKVLAQGLVAESSLSQDPGAGWGSLIYLFAHSSSKDITAVRKNPVFYLIGELVAGDSIWVEKNGVKYLYKVYTTKIVGANEIQYLSYSEKNKEILILQSCWPIGTDWNRILVFAQREEL